MTVKTLEDREFLRSVFLETWDAAVLDLLERGANRHRLRAAMGRLKAKVIGSLPLAIGMIILYLYI